MSRLTALLLIAGLLATGATASAQDTSPGENLGGYDASASGSAFSFQPFFPALISTGDVPAEVTIGLSTAGVRSGGNAVGHAAVLWPGSAVANLGPLVGTGFGEEELAALIPSWPLQARATQTDGEVETSVPPAIVMRARGFPDEASGESRLADVDVPSLVRIDDVTSTSTTLVTDNDVVAVARVAMQGVSLFDGQITIEGVRTIARTNSSGTRASSSGDTDIVGMRIGGVEVSVTDRGFAVEGAPSGDQIPGGDGEPVPGQDPESAVAGVLDALGVRMTLFESSTTVEDGHAERFEPGLVISIDNPVGNTGAIPPGRFDIFLAAVSSSALASETFSGVIDDGTDTPVSAPAPTPAQRSSIGSGAEVDRSTLEGVGSSLAAAPGEAAGLPEEELGIPGVLPQSSDYEFGGVPITLALVLLLAAAIAARYIRRFFDRITQ